ncbi:MAG: TrkA family potassium uptake protein [Eubacterium sp.]|jgi:trk system potassium uptake protein TrkA|nr:TrkA family potassium uptake protein [Eubacterium sp.]MCH4007195.1 TrkA family potassium uptake protein [Eubacterium sp.]MCH4045943.1 TrkA family potassium uptake protein [Eubacterium sp.]MCH4047452.1 TrkA family potassium uptake protein [Eubacterium sp.]MCH4079037.1 TrkA family potassium uptake protein [Eubacterium sp.]
MKSVLIIGLGNFGLLLAKKVHELGHQVLAIDKDEERVNAALPFVNDAMIGDSTNEGFLRSLGINNFDVSIVTIGNDFQSSLVTTSLLKELGGKLVISRANREVQEKFLLRNGADEVVNPEKQIAKWTAIRFTSDNILDYIELDKSHAILEVKLPEAWMGKSVGEVDIRKKYGLNIMAVKENDRININILPDLVFTKGQTLLVLGEQKSIQKCFHI